VRYLPTSGLATFREGTDDAPFINYTDVSGSTAYCQQHLFDTSQLTTDLKSASSTPSFSWIAADDYYDGEPARRLQHRLDDRARARHRVL
jgi:hypothetical protein